MNIMSADGQEVTPLTIQRLFIGPGETYDLLVQMPRTGSWELRATSIDGSGHTSIWLGEGSRHKSPDVPKPNMYHFMGKLALKQILAPGPASAMGMPDSDVEAGRFDNPGMHGMEGMEDMKRMDPMPGMDEHSGDDSGNAAHNNHQAGAMHEHGGNTPAGVSETHENPNHGGMAPMHEDHSMIQQTVQESAAREVTTPGYAIDGSEPERPWPPYARLRAVSSTALPAAKPVRQIRLTLDGDMRRYIWSMGNKPLSESDDILIRGGETVRFILINRTMMHHPMHLHGHLFRVLNGQGDFAPLKHTVDVPPMSTVAIEFDANEPGNWFFHCHQLYHMESGMARVVHYEGFQTDPALAAARPELAMDEWYVQGTGHFSSNMTEGMLSLSNIRTTLRAEWEIGWAQVAGSHQEGLVTLERYQNGFTSFFAGARFEGDQGMTEKVRGVMGARYLLPLYLDSMIWVDTAGDVRLALAKELPLTSRLGLECEVQYDTQEEWKGATSLSYLLDRNFSLEGNWNSHYGFGAGLRLRF